MAIDLERQTNLDLELTEGGVTIVRSDLKKCWGYVNPRLSVLREFVLATVYISAKDHHMQFCSSGAEQEAKRQFYTCDLVTQSGLAGMQWKKILGEDIHLTLTEQKRLKNLESLQLNVERNAFSVNHILLDPRLLPGELFPFQSAADIHVAECDGSTLMKLKAFDFVYVDPGKTPASYFSTLFQNVRNSGVVCVVVPDIMQFARTPHVVRRFYGATCFKTEYLKEMAARIVMASLASEAAKCNKGLSMLYAVFLEDFLLLGVKVSRGTKMADTALQNIGHVLHCRICEERVFYPDSISPLEDPYSILDCDCHRSIPGKTAVIIGPMWKSNLYDWPFLQQLSKAAQEIKLSQAFTTLLKKVMEDCLCDTPPLTATAGKLTEGVIERKINAETDSNSKHEIIEQYISSSPPLAESQSSTVLEQLSKSKEDPPVSDKHDAIVEHNILQTQECSFPESDSGDHKECSETKHIQAAAEVVLEKSPNIRMDLDGSLVLVQSQSANMPGTTSLQHNGSQPMTLECTSSTSSVLDMSSSKQSEQEENQPVPHHILNQESLELDMSQQCTATNSSTCSVQDISSTVQEGNCEKQEPSLKRSASGGEEGLEEDTTPAKRICTGKKEDGVLLPMPPFYYSVHSKRVAKGRIPKQQEIIQRLRASGFRCCRTHFEKYSFRTDANLKALTNILGSGENNVLYVRGGENSSSAHRVVDT